MKLQHSSKNSPAKAPAERVVKDIQRQARRHFSAEDKIRIVLDGPRGEDSIAELCRKEGIARYRMPSLRDMGHRITLEFIAEIGLPHRPFLSSKLGSKASRNLGATQVRKVSVPLRPSGGRVFANNAEPNGIDRCSIELKCRWSPSLMGMFDTGIRIGEDKHKPLTWDGKDVLPVTSAVIVWKRAVWDSDADRLRPVHRRAQPKEYEPHREHVELMDAVKRLEANLVKLATPLWIAAIAAVMAVWLSR